MALIPKAVLLICLIPRTAYCQPTLNAADFQCFINRFAAGDPWANCDNSTVPNTGWTDLSLPLGAHAYYVAANGNDSAPGTEAAPLRTIQAAYARCLDGGMDQVRLRCGDAWTVSQVNVYKSNVTVCSYGTGPRPRITVTGPTGFRGESLGKSGARFCDLEVVGENRAGTSGICMLGWDDILIEGCHVHGFADCLVIQGFGTRTIGVKIRRNIIADATYPPTQFDPNGNPTNRGQGAYLDQSEDILIEQNVFERCGIPGSMFGRPLYIFPDCERPIVRENVTANNPAEGLQVRTGGDTTNNLSIADPCGIFVGNGQPGTNRVEWNVVLISGDISPTQRRGIGIHVNGPSIVRFNLCAANVGTGEGSVKAIWFNGASGECYNNVVDDWARSGGPGDVRESFGLHIEGGSGSLQVNLNTVHQRRPGYIAEILNSGLAIGGTGNRYSTPITPFRTAAPGAWQAATTPPDPNLVGRLPGGSVAAYMALARQQSRQSWNPALEARSVNAGLRPAVGLPNP